VKVRWTEQAFTRLADIEDYVGADSPTAAQRLSARLVRGASTLARNPNLGRRVPELPGSGLRELIDGNYRIVYRVRPPRVEILTVFEGHRRFPLADVDTKDAEGLG
jgi:plasmid stabilization system protein ParE